MKQKTLWIFLIIGLLLSACGYRFRGSGRLPFDIQTVFVRIFENRTAETGLENVFTDDFIYEVIRNGIVDLTDEGDAEGIFSGVIQSIRTEPISRKDIQTSVEDRVTIGIDLTLTDPDGKIKWSAIGVYDNETYKVESDKLLEEKNRREAIAALSKRLAESVHNRLTSDF